MKLARRNRNPSGPTWPWIVGGLAVIGAGWYFLLGPGSGTAAAQTPPPGSPPAGPSSPPASPPSSGPAGATAAAAPPAATGPHVATL